MEHLLLVFGFASAFGYFQHFNLTFGHCISFLAISFSPAPRWPTSRRVDEETKVWWVAKGALAFVMDMLDDGKNDI